MRWMLCFALLFSAVAVAGCHSSEKMGDANYDTVSLSIAGMT